MDWTLVLVADIVVGEGGEARVKRVRRKEMVAVLGGLLGGLEKWEGGVGGGEGRGRTFLGEVLWLVSGGGKMGVYK